MKKKKYSNRYTQLAELKKTLNLNSQTPLIINYPSKHNAGNPSYEGVRKRTNFEMHKETFHKLV